MEPACRCEMVEDSEEIGCPSECFLGGDQQRLALGCTALALGPDDGSNRVITRGNEPESLRITANPARDLGEREASVIVQERAHGRVHDRLTARLASDGLLVQGEDRIVGRPALVRGDDVEHHPRSYRSRRGT